MAPESPHSFRDYLLGSAAEQALNELTAVRTQQGVADPAWRARADLVQALLNYNDFITVR